MPAASAMAAPVQWVASCGGSVAVRATTRSMTSSPPRAGTRLSNTPGGRARHLEQRHHGAANS